MTVTRMFELGCQAVEARLQAADLTAKDRRDLITAGRMMVNRAAKYKQRLEKFRLEKYYSELAAAAAAHERAGTVMQQTEIDGIIAKAQIKALDLPPGLGAKARNALAAMPFASDKATADALGMRVGALLSMLRTLHKNGLVVYDDEPLRDGRTGPPPRIWRRVGL